MLKERTLESKVQYLLEKVAILTALSVKGGRMTKDTVTTGGGTMIATDMEIEHGLELHYTMAHAGPKLQAQLDRIEEMLKDLLAYQVPRVGR